MKKHYTCLVVLILLANISFEQTLSRAWVNISQDSTAAYFNLSDMAVDANGNTYLSGYEIYPGDDYYQTHLILLKVNAAGVLEWKRNFSPLKDSIDEAVAVTTDSAGFIYVTGKRVDTFCNICTYSSKISDVITMKYDGYGNRIWLNRYHDSDYILAAPSDITISAGGAIIITANETHYVPALGTYVNNLLLERINKYGETVWIKKRNKTVANSACFDNDNNIIVAGASDSQHLYQTQKPLVLKYKPNGTLLWTSTYDEYEKTARCIFVKCDAENNIYANGQTDTIAFNNNPKIITIKYNSSGQQQWFRKEDDHSTTLPHFFGDFTADAAGNCYITGFVSKSDVDDDWLVTKYNSSGVKLWSTTFDDSLHASDKPIGLAVDTKGNTFVTGYVYNTSGNYAIATVAYDKTGALLSSDIFTRGKSNEFATGIGLDKNNNIYTGGTISLHNSSYPASVVIKYRLKQPSITAEKPGINAMQLTLFPNPAVNTLNVVFTTSTPAKNYNLAIHDVSGNVVLLKQVNIAEKTINTNLDVSSFKPGVYTATISDGINAVSKIFLKK